MFRWFRSLFSWHAVRRGGNWVYLENSVTGQRKVIDLGGAHTPLNVDWVRNGDIVVSRRGRYVKGSEGELWV